MPSYNCLPKYIHPRLQLWCLLSNLTAGCSTVATIIVDAVSCGCGGIVVQSMRVRLSWRVLLQRLVAFCLGSRFL